MLMTNKIILKRNSTSSDVLKYRVLNFRETATTTTAHTHIPQSRGIVLCDGKPTRIKIKKKKN